MTKYRDRKDGFTIAELEAALCAFEWMMDEKARFDRTAAEDRAEHTVTIERLFDSMGWTAMRFMAMQAGAIADQVYQYAEAEGWEFSDCFDWDFVPAVLRRLDWDALAQDNQLAGPVYWPEPAPLLAALIEAMPDSFGHTSKAERYMQRCYAEAERQWGYRELPDDHPERVQAAFSDSQDPAEFIKLLGEKYDLTPRREWERGF